MRIGIILNYTTNFKVSQTFKRRRKKKKMKTLKMYLKPKFLKKKSNLKKKESIRAPILSCKSTLFFLLYINNNIYSYTPDEHYFDEHPIIKLESCVFFLSSSFKKYYTLLRAPYRYKIARNQFQFKRFSVLCFLKFKVRQALPMLVLSSSFYDLFSILNILVSLYKDIDTNVCNQNYSIVYLHFSFKNYFFFKNFQ